MDMKGLHIDRRREAFRSVPRAAGALQRPASEGPHILVVDDIEDNRQMLRRRFETRGFRISEAADGETALRLVETTAFDAVLLDVMMPDIDGFTVLRRMRALPGAALTPIIMVTARTQSSDVIAALDEGADDYITKPVDFGVALARVNSQIARAEAQKLVMQAATKLEHLAYHDALTGLGNRAKFMKRLQAAADALGDADEMLGVMFVDLDGFKAVNDRLGHQAGDELLQRIGAGLRAIASPSIYVARLGGDEFALLISGRDLRRTCRELADAIVRMVSGVGEIAGGEIHVGASIGIAMGAGRDPCCQDILRAADQAMYRAKMRGKGCYEFAGGELRGAA